MFDMEARKVTIKLTEDMLGTVAKDAKIYTKYIEDKKPEELKGEKEADTVMEDLENKGWTGFHCDDEGLFLYDYIVKGFLKNAGNILKEHLSIQALKSKISNQVFVYPRRVHLGIEKPEVALERPLRAQTPQGPRVSLVKSDVVPAGTVITFEIRWIKGNKITENVLKKILSYGQLQGLGQWRNGGYGRFELISIEKIK